jgi:hypothetical protein
MLAKLTEYKQRLVTSYLRDQDGEGDRVLPRAEEREALRALGYVH